ncbi:MAG: hypothetical protein ABSE16_18130 [Verrucomicrobiota bacterium]
MKTSALIGSAALLAGLLAASSAQATVTLTFTESGGTSASGGSDPYSAIGSPTAIYDDLTASQDGYGTIPGPIGLSTLDFGAPTSLYAGGPNAYPEWGYVAIYAYGTPNSDYGTTTGLLDIVHFDNSGSYNGVQTGQQMFWYSGEGSGQLANTSWTSLLGSSVLTSILKFAGTADITEGADGSAAYTPSSSSSPGAVLNSSKSYNYYTYDFQSSVIPVPEASTIIAGALLVLPFGAGTLRILRRRWMA